MKSGKFAHAQTSINQLTSNSTLPWSVGFEEFRFFCCFVVSCGAFGSLSEVNSDLGLMVSDATVAVY